MTKFKNPVAVKRIWKRKFDNKNVICLQRETDILQNPDLDRDFIVQHYSHQVFSKFFHLKKKAISDPSFKDTKNYLYFVMEWCDTDLHTLIRRGVPEQSVNSSFLNSPSTSFVFFLFHLIRLVCALEFWLV